MKDISTFYDCDCGGEALHVSVLEWDDAVKLICFSFWKLGHDQGYSWRYRFQHIWHIVRKGHPYLDEVLLKPEEARKLADELLRLTR